MTLTIEQPARQQVPVPVAKTLPSIRFSQLRPKVVPYLRPNLRAYGIGAFSPKFSAIASRERLGKDSQKWLSLVESQGVDFHNWTCFASGCSVETLERWKQGRTVSPSVHIAFCKAVELITSQPFPVEEVTAIEPDFQAESYAMQVLVSQVRAKLLSGISTTIGMNTPRWKESDHALGVPLHVGIDNIVLTRVKASLPFKEFEIQVCYKNQAIPIGRVIATEQYSLILDSRPFLWTGVDLTIGRKLIRLILPKGNIRLHLERLITSALSDVETLDR